MNKLKVVTIVGTRPEIIRLSMVIPKLDKYTDHVFVHTGQNSDPKLNEIFFEDLELRQPNYYLNVDTSSMGAVMGDTLKKAEEVFLKEKPDAVMILGDTNSAIAAVVAERMHIPVYHMEAGNRSFDNNVPEELNRKMVDHVSTFNLPYNEYSMRNLLAEGIHPRFIQKTGSPIREIVSHYREKITNSRVLDELGLRSKEFILLSLHRQENVDDPARLERAISSIEFLGQQLKLPILVSTHPRTQRKLEMHGISERKGFNFHRPFGYLDYNKLQLEAKVVISDSGTISEESAVLGFKAVSLRDSIERPEALETGSILLTGLNQDNLLRCVELVLNSESSSLDPTGYEIEDFSERILRFLFSTASNAKLWTGRRGSS